MVIAPLCECSIQPPAIIVWRSFATAAEFLPIHKQSKVVVDQKVYAVRNAAKNGSQPVHIAEVHGINFNTRPEGLYPRELRRLITPIGHIFAQVFEPHVHGRGQPIKEKLFTRRIALRHEDRVRAQVPLDDEPATQKPLPGEHKAEVLFANGVGVRVNVGADEPAVLKQEVSRLHLARDRRLAEGLGIDYAIDPPMVAHTKPITEGYSV